jgi:hypothetical protein
MPTVLRFGSWRVVVYPNDHRPAHVHVIGRGCEAVFDLHCRGSRPELRENFGCSRRQLGTIGKVVGKQVERLCRAWEELHGVDY